MAIAIRSFSGKYCFLSNFAYGVKIVDEFGLEYPTVEHAYQAAKSDDIRIRSCFLYGTPGQAKINGRRVEIRRDWDAVRINIMRDFLRQKFSQEPFKSKLLETGDFILVEGNTWGDTFWGVCNGEGQNMLGKLLMELRCELQQNKSNNIII